jgi:hypothetical protein
MIPTESHSVGHSHARTPDLRDLLAFRRLLLRKEREGAGVFVLKRLQPLGLGNLHAMPKSEREDLQRLIRQREKVLKSAAKQRSAELLADFENQMGQQYSFDDDHVWAEAAKIANAAVSKVQEQIKARCREIGIPDRFAPSITLGWHHRGYGNSLKERRDELRKMAETAIEAQEQKARTQIELSCLDAQEKLALAGLTSDAARGFIEALPSITDLMPRLSFAEVAGEAAGCRAIVVFERVTPGPPP